MKYKLNQLYVDTGKSFEFQISSTEAVGIEKCKFIDELVTFIGDIEKSLEEITNYFYNNKIEGYNYLINELVSKNILIEVDNYNKIVCNILREHISILIEQKGLVNSIKTIFKFNGIYDGHQTIRMVYAAVKYGVQFKMKIVDGNTTIIRFYKDNITRVFSSNDNYGLLHDDFRSNYISRFKSITSFLLSRNNIAVPKQNLFIDNDYNNVLNFISKIGYPVCIKSDSGFEGKDAFPFLINNDEVKKVINYLSDKNKQFVVEEHVEGDCYRFYVIDNVVLPGFYVKYTTITGDGLSTIKELIEDINKKNRQCDKSSKEYYIKLKLNQETLLLLTRLGLTPQSILPKDKTITINYCEKNSRNPAIDFKEFNEEVGEIVIKAIKTIGLNIGAVDYVTTDITKSPEDTNGKVIEVQDNPTFLPYMEVAQKYFDEIIKYLFVNVQ